MLHRLWRDMEHRRRAWKQLACLYSLVVMVSMRPVERSVLMPFTACPMRHLMAEVLERSRWHAASNALAAA